MDWLKRAIVKTIFLIGMLAQLTVFGAEKKEKITKAAWEETIKDRSFKEIREKPKPRKKTNLPSLGWLKGLGNVILIFFLVIIVAAIGFILFRLLSGMQSNKKVVPVKVLNLDHLEEHIDDVDFDALLQEAIQAQNYKLAIRIYFLKALKNLSLANRIQWSNEKTNLDYLMEMSQDKEYTSFRNLIRIFEIAWYSDHEINKSHFDTYQENYSSFIHRTTITEKN